MTVAHITHTQNLQDPRTLFTFFLTCMYASQHSDLGYDPTMTPAPPSNGFPQYDITVHTEDGKDHVYRTIHKVGGRGECILLGSGTWIWEAVRLIDGKQVGEPVLLKDTWVNYHRPREGTTYADLWAAATTAEQRTIQHRKATHVSKA